MRDGAPQPVSDPDADTRRDPCRYQARGSSDGLIDQAKNSSATDKPTGCRVRAAVAKREGIGEPRKARSTKDHRSFSWVSRLQLGIETVVDRAIAGRLLRMY